MYCLKLKKMKTISLKIDDSIFGETEKILSNIKKPRNRYINEALEFYNRFQQRLILEKKLKKESTLVGDDSIDVLKEFEGLDDAN
ncbi:MAG: hypothetical protein KFKLKKLM_02066 [Flavobacteriales bacterium]|nr:hypothetical protein [Flavobacteriales bacterium]